MRFLNLTSWLATFLWAAPALTHTSSFWGECTLRALGNFKDAALHGVYVFPQYVQSHLLQYASVTDVAAANDHLAFVMLQ